MFDITNNIYTDYNGLTYVDFSSVKTPEGLLFLLKPAFNLNRLLLISNSKSPIEYRGELKDFKIEQILTDKNVIYLNYLTLLFVVMLIF